MVFSELPIETSLLIIYQPLERDREKERFSHCLIKKPSQETVLIHVSVPQVWRYLLDLVRQLGVKPYSTATIKVISSGTWDQGPLISYTILVVNFSFQDYLQIRGHLCAIYVPTPSRSTHHFFQSVKCMTISRPPFVLRI